jgi:hypothetical protein
VAGATVALGSILAGCGGTRQDAHEPARHYKVSVLNASFPTTQTLSSQSALTVQVRNDDTQTIPQLAVSVSSFNVNSSRPGLADPSRPVWIVDQGPAGGESAYTNTWALGALAPGQVRAFTWKVTAVRAGVHTIDYAVAAGLNGKATAVLAGGGRPGGRFTVRISRCPAQARVNFDTGKVIRKAPAGAAAKSCVPAAAGGTPGVNHGTQGPNDAQAGSGSGSSPNAGAGAQPGSP